mgnify:CR=1 FL=1
MPLYMSLKTGDKHRGVLQAGNMLHLIEDDCGTGPENRGPGQPEPGPG